MILCIGNVLNKDDLDFTDSKLQGATFIDGRVTAGWSARLVKNNEQAQSDEALDELRATLEERILGNEVFQLAAQPKVLTPILISRYAPGRQYGTHVDDALMSGMRTDLSFTLFLSEPDTYEGGELVMETSAGEQPYKLPAGAMIVYPSTTLHRVMPVESGLRVATVGWVRSYLRSAECREILFDLETARREMFQRHGKTPAFDLLSKCSSNLLRLWAED
jgi:PKHD-type hydroxylase